MCLYEKYILNPKFKPNKKNGYNPPKCTDKREQYIIMKCGKCLECYQDKVKEWKTRIFWECYYHTGKIYYVTMTFTDDVLNAHAKRAHDDNTICKIYIKKFCDNWKYHLGEKCTHFLIPEHGQDTNFTERLHIHGLIWTSANLPAEGFQLNNHIRDTLWHAGNVKFEVVRDIARCTGYIVKYISKIDRIHPSFHPKLFVSKGLGKEFTLDKTKKHIYRYQGDETKHTIYLPNESPAKIPTYYKHKLWTDEERHKMWMESFENYEKRKGERNFKMLDYEENRTYQQYIKQLRKKSKELGYN